MKTNPRLKISFDKESDSNLNFIAAYILICMTDNVYFTTPVPSLAEVSAALEAYRAALEDAKSRNPTSIAIKNEKRGLLLGLLKNLGLYIMSVANGSQVILSSCGYPLAKVPGPRTICDPGLASLKKGDSSGKMEASVKPPKPCPGFLFQICNMDPESGAEPAWISFGSTVNKYVFTNLVPGTKYWVRAASIGARGQQIFGPVSSEFAI